MADELFFNTKTMRRKKPLSTKVLSLIILLLCITVILEIVFHFFIAPNLVISHVTVDGDPLLPDQEILRIAGIEESAYYFSLDCAQVEASLREYPAVKDATVVKHFPNRLQINIVSRKPIGLSVAEVSGRMLPIAFDESGTVFSAGKDISDFTLPVLSGIRFENFRLGTKLPPELQPFLLDLAELQRSSPIMFSLISELRIAGSRNSSFDLLLYPVHQKIPVRISPEIDRTLLSNIYKVLYVLNNEGLLNELEEIDFRSGEVVYVRKEE